MPGGGRASVYADTRELDAWLKSGKALEVGSALEAAVEEQPEAKPADSAQSIPEMESEGTARECLSRRSVRQFSHRDEP